MSESVHLLIKDRNKGPLKLKETFKLPSSFQTKAANPLYFILLDHKTKQEEQKIKSIEHHIDVVDNSIRKLQNKLFSSNIKLKSGNPYRFEGRIRVSSEDEVTNLIKIKEKEVKELKAKMFIRKLNEEKRNREAFKEKQKLKIEQNMISVLKEIAKVNEKNSSLHLKNHKRIGDISTIRDKSLSKPLELPVIKNSSEITDVKDRGSFRGYYLNEESHSNVPWKNSPYYFNDPKLNKLLDDRGKYNHNKYAKLYMKYSTEKL